MPDACMESNENVNSRVCNALALFAEKNHASEGASVVCLQEEYDSTCVRLRTGRNTGVCKANI